MNKPFVAVLMGSDSDFPVMQSTLEILKSFDIAVEVKVTSAHRTPAATHQYVTDAESRGCKVCICAAGLAAHLAGAVAGITTRPVIGVPIDGGPLKGLDALLSTVQMPSGIPVATVAVDGGKNAALLAVQIMAVSDAELAQKLDEARTRERDAVLRADEEVRALYQ